MSCKSNFTGQILILVAIMDDSIKKEGNNLES